MYMGLVLIKQQKYWPLYIDGNIFQKHLDDKNIGDCEARKGVKDGLSFYIYSMKEPDYMMLMMATYGTLEENKSSTAKRKYKNENGNEKIVSFCYTEPFFNYFKYRHLVDDHNLNCHQPISVEDAFGARHWPLRQFTFLMAVSEVNNKLALHGVLEENDYLSMLLNC